MNCCLVNHNGSCWFNQGPFFKTDFFVMPIVDKIIHVSIALTERSETVLPEVVNNDVNWGPTEVSLSKSWTRIGILFPKLIWSSVRKNCSIDREKLLKFEAEGTEFAKFLRPLKQFNRTVITIFQTECFFNFFQEVSQILYNKTIQIGKRKLAKVRK